MKKYVIALDQGTTSSRAIIFDINGKTIEKESKEIKQFYPKAGWVEQDPMEILDSQISVLKEVLKKSDINVEDIVSIGITNQRESVVVWNKKTGKPVYNAIGWQCRRTASFCDELKEKGYEDLIKKKTGLVVDAYFSASKIKWILDNCPDAKRLANEGELLAGTIDTWLLWNLTDKEVFATEYSNASRTMLFNIKDLKWDSDLLKIFDIHSNMLASVQESASYFGNVSRKIINKGIPITGIIGDQQGALFGQGCFKKGCVKNTYGTGCFMLMNTGEEIVESKNNLLTTIAWGINGKVEYAIEGSVFVAGAAVQWLRDNLKMIENAKETESIAIQVDDTNGVYVVPAFVGLGAPYWDMYAQGAITGLTRGSNRNHIVRATLESIAYQTRDVLESMSEDSGFEISELKVDGGASSNNFLMQFQSDIIGKKVIRPENIESTALGASYMALYGAELWKNNEGFCSTKVIDREYTPSMSLEEQEEKYAGWKKAVKRCMNDTR